MNFTFNQLGKVGPKGVADFPRCSDLWWRLHSFAPFGNNFSNYSTTTLNVECFYYNIAPRKTESLSETHFATLIFVCISIQSIRFHNLLSNSGFYKVVEACLT